jgi:hypothetical protein
MKIRNYNLQCNNQHPIRKQFALQDSKETTKVVFANTKALTETSTPKSTNKIVNLKDSKTKLASNHEVVKEVKAITQNPKPVQASLLTFNSNQAHYKPISPEVVLPEEEELLINNYSKEP